MAGVGEEEVVRSPGSGQEAGLQGSEGRGEPQSVEEAGPESEPGQSCLLGSEEGLGSGRRRPRAAAGRELDLRCWIQEAEGPCSSPGSVPDSALGLTP